MSITQPAGFTASGVAAGLKIPVISISLVVNSGPGLMPLACSSNQISAAGTLVPSCLGDGKLKQLFLIRVALMHVPDFLAMDAAEMASCGNPWILLPRMSWYVDRGLIGERLPMNKVITELKQLWTLSEHGAKTPQPS